MASYDFLWFLLALYGGVYRVGVWRLQAFLLWRLASRGNISGRLASTKLGASASTCLFLVASGVYRLFAVAFGIQMRYFPTSGVYRISRVRFCLASTGFFPGVLASTVPLISPPPICYHVLASKRLKLLEAGFDISMYYTLNK